VKNLISKALKRLPYLKQVFCERDQLRVERDQLRVERDQLRVERDQLRVERDQLRVERDQLRVERDQLRAETYELQRGWPPGHFYSPIPSIEEVKLREKEIFNNIPRGIPGVDLNEEGQVHLLHELKKHYHDQPFEAQKKDDVRYFFENPNYSYGEAIILYCMIRHAQPKKIIELGSGYSSCAILDTNELFFDNAISCTFIDPYPQLLQSLIKDSDIERIEIIQKNVQDVSIDKFSELSAGDILFVDSSHVSKVNSDVNHIFFEILPHIKGGIYIHFHDVGYPFEYPKEWIYEGRAWNEAYLLRAFLQYNNAFRIRFFNSFMAHAYRDMLAREMPMCMKNPGTSIWIQKI
jgi:predicted O-methyltransferase YrrM